jgi:hypothetical protein
MCKPIVLLPEQMPLEIPLPKVVNNVDYRRMENLLRRTSDVLVVSGVEDQMVQSAVKRKLEQLQSQENFASFNQVQFQTAARQALRCNIARGLHQESYRSFSTHLAESRLLQWFCLVDTFDTIVVPTKSTLQRFAQMYSSQEIQQINALLLGQAALREGPLQLAEPIDLDTLFMDSTCVKANIHFPVDWVLLRDASRTIICGIECIRRHGLKHRIPAPESLISTVNRHCIAMTQSRRQKKDSRRLRKVVFRRLKRTVKLIADHGRRYVELLEKQWARTDWSQAQAQQVIDRMKNVLDQLPEAQRQAHERLIGKGPVPNNQKILSLYEPDIHVLVRGKAGAPCEFGNGLLLAENPQGLLVHWEFFKQSPPSDSGMVIPVIEKVEALLNIKVQSVAGDRIFDTKENAQYLKEKEVFNALCDRGRAKRRGELEKEAYRGMQRRRAQTEARIGLFKNNFLGRPLRMKGYKSRDQAVAWAVLTHNVWVLARQPKAEAKGPPITLAEAA